MRLHSKASGRPRRLVRPLARQRVHALQEPLHPAELRLPLERDECGPPSGPRIMPPPGDASRLRAEDSAGVT